ncbi:glycosyltransferase family 9 protein [Pseudodesulfovibrio cashew]|uniref:Glycosyltransferase family 9 protein n=1 Tax=Pseudodesulfovibrio cashew TaxID=2678688 RepID=A0A6I6JIU8_9BACT|nr:glycosyltransferase family 9 protein [Pseudodesulfovibrio cashew]QGY40878.1 glycosyltransferase family 9 protein [Pseudodesulfovibrio cashew]
MIELATYTPKRILACQLRQIGDVVLFTPCLRLLRKRYPDAAIHVLTEKKCVPILENNPNVDHIWPIDRKALKNPLKALAYYAKVGRAGYDLIVDFQQLPRTKWVVRLSNAPVRLTFTPPWYNRFGYTHWTTMDRAYAAIAKASVLKPLGVEWDGLPPEMFMTEVEMAWADAYLAGIGFGDAPFLAVDPSHRRETRRWPASYFARLVNLIRERHPAMRALILWGPGERELAERVAGEIGEAAVVPDELQSLREMAAVQKRAALHIGNCSAPRHMAIAVGTPSLVMHGATGPGAWCFPSREHISLNKKLPCQPCNSNDCEHRNCLKQLLPEECLPSALELLDLSVGS